MPSPHQVIHIHPEAPPKPPLGEPCNGCGVCCLAEPCPVGMLISRKRRGACDALVWSDPEGRYLCGLLVNDAASPPREGGLRRVWTRGWRRLWRRLWRAWVRRLISSGSGCDASMVVERPR